MTRLSWLLHRHLGTTRAAVLAIRAAVRTSSADQAGLPVVELVGSTSSADLAVLVAIAGKGCAGARLVAFVSF